MSLVFETILPYVKNKVMKWVSANKERNERLCKIIEVVVYASELSIFGYQFRYMIDPNFKHFKPYLQLFGIIIREQNQFEQQQVHQNWDKKSMLGKFLGILQQYSIFVLFVLMKWCEWYFSRSSNSESMSARI